MKYIYLKLLMAYTFFTIIGCAQPISNELHINFRNSQMCIYTDNENTYLTRILLKPMTP